METLLRRVIEASGLSRRAAFAAIRGGRVGVRGKRRSDPSSAYTGGSLTLDGVRLETGQPARVYIMLHKPKGFLTTTADDRGRGTVMDLLPEPERVPGLFPVGRLDKDTTGLLLLTNDGDLSFRMTHPSQRVEKEYWVALSERIPDDKLQRVAAGVQVEGTLRRPIQLRRLEKQEPYELTITLGEGSKRQVRRMLEAVGFGVVELLRVREGPLHLGDLEEGSWRRLSPAELAACGVGGKSRA